MCSEDVVSVKPMIHKKMFWFPLSMFWFLWIWKAHYGICASSWVLVFAIYLCVFPNFEVLKSLIPDWGNIESLPKTRLLIKTTLSSFKQTQGTWEYGELADDVVAINGMVEQGNNITLQSAEKINLKEMHFKSTPHWRVNKYRNTKRLT